MTVHIVRSGDGPLSLPHALYAPWHFKGMDLYGRGMKYGIMGVCCDVSRETR